MIDDVKVRRLMSAKGFTVTRLARKVGVSPQHLSNILNHTRGVSTETLRAIAISLDTDAAGILNIPGEEANSAELDTHEQEYIVVEKSVRVKLPRDRASYELVRSIIDEPSGEVDDQIKEMLLLADDEAKGKVLRLLRDELSGE